MGGGKRLFEVGGGRREDRTLHHVVGKVVGGVGPQGGFKHLIRPSGWQRAAQQGMGTRIGCWPATTGTFAKREPVARTVERIIGQQHPPTGAPDRRVPLVPIDFATLDIMVGDAASQHGHLGLTSANRRQPSDGIPSDRFLAKPKQRRPGPRLNTDHRARIGNRLQVVGKTNGAAEMVAPVARGRRCGGQAAGEI